MSEIMARLHVDMSGAQSELDAFRDRLLALPKDVAQVVLHRFLSLLEAKPFELVPLPTGATTDAGDCVIRLGVTGMAELISAALAADGPGLADVSHVEPSI